MLPVNRNGLWASIFVDELARSGLEAVCIAPGSRSTALTLAFAEHENIRVYVHLDERSASYFALGLAMASEKPVALLCTSGTATANFFPAIIEAQQSRIPLLVLTSDRPHELRHSGANQTIDQVKMYGDQVLWSVDVALPEAESPAVALRNLRTLAGRSMAVANGLRKGVVHLNFPFRKPLEPTPVSSDIITIPETAKSRDHQRAYTQILHGNLEPSKEQIHLLSDLIDRYDKGVIVCGGKNLAKPKWIKKLSKKTGYPIFAEPLSGVRYGNENSLSAYDHFLRVPELPKPDLILRFGNVPTSKQLNLFLNASDAIQVHIEPSGVWSDDAHRTDYLFQVDPNRLVQKVLGEIFEKLDAWLEMWRELDDFAWEQIHSELGKYDFDGAIIAQVMDQIPEDAHVFVANSLPIRHVEQYARSSAKRLFVYGNRGASGIDGIVSTALGIGANFPHEPLFLITGDLSLYHDMNGLLAIQKHKLNIIIILMNNDGGGIFQRLPIADYDPPFTDLFLTPHGLNFRHVADLYSLEYENPDSVDQVNLAENGARLIEFKTDSAKDNLIRKQIEQTVHNKSQNRLTQRRRDAEKIKR